MQLMLILFLRNMETSSELDNARFMQPLLPGFIDSFSIPKAFLTRLEKELKGRSLEIVTLTTEDQPLRQWIIKLEGGCRFKEGWKGFCGDHGLKVGDFVVFAYQLDLFFQVSVFDPASACELNFYSSYDADSIPKHIGSKTKWSAFKFNYGDKVSGKRRSSEAQVQDKQAAEDQKLSCQIILSSFAYKKSIVYLPKKFVRSNDLENRRCCITLRNSEGKRWQVKLCYRKYDRQAYICGGWRQFQAANRIRPRDRICFQVLKRGRWPVMKCYQLSNGSKS